MFGDPRSRACSNLRGGDLPPRPGPLDSARPTADLSFPSPMQFHVRPSSQPKSVDGLTQNRFWMKLTEAQNRNMLNHYRDTWLWGHPGTSRPAAWFVEACPTPARSASPPLSQDRLGSASSGSGWVHTMYVIDCLPWVMEVRRSVSDALKKLDQNTYCCRFHPENFGSQSEHKFTSQ